MSFMDEEYLGRMDFHVLGPLRAYDGSTEIDLGGPKQRLVLAMLLAVHGATISTDALIEGVWSDAAPVTARKTLQGYVHHLRSRIPDGLVTDRAGYSLDVSNRRVDERTFSATVEETRPLVASDPLFASDTLSGVLDLWKGSPYADLDGAPVLLPEIVRLNEARMVALGDRIEADLALGRHDLLIGELESLTIDCPLRERFHGLHMVALYRAGRHGEALRAYARTRDLFIDETGLEPSKELQDLERRILDRDPALSATAEHAPGAPRAIRGYELREQILTDATGTVYRGYQRSVGREVAMRVTGPHVADDPYFIANYESDVARVARLDHPNILYVQDTWREPGSAIQVMRWIEGQRLDRHLADNRPTDWTALRIIEQIGDALMAAHRGGVVHGDVCARTVLWSDGGDAYLTDFVVGRPVGTEFDDHAAFVCLAFHLVFGVEPRSPGDLCGLLASTITSSELRCAFEIALADGGGGDSDDFVRALRRAIGGDVVELADEPDVLPLTDVRCPYKGLQAFEPTDASDFFGRDDLVDHLEHVVRRRRLVTVVGPSGSGKSSLVKAGLMPRLRAAAPWFLVARMYPGAYPFEALERALRSVAVIDGAISDQLRLDARGLCRVLDDVLPDDESEVILVIDQFEELFAVVASESVRVLFLENLVSAVTDPGSRLRVVLTLRADFFDRPLRYAEFGGLIEAGLVPVSMPDHDGLAAAIEEPALAVGVRLQPGLVAEMIRDVAEQPGGLPLLQYALTDLFDRREADTLTIDGYRAAGGVAGALATRAEALFTDLGPAGRRAMQQAFLRMVTVDEGADHVRRRVTRADLAAIEVDRDALDDGLQRFGAHRLLTFDSDPVSRAPTVEVAHESLLREWGRLQQWIAEQRDQLVVRKRLDAAVREWEESGEDPAFLLRGRRLNQFDGWAADTDMALSSTERAFLQVSREHDEAQVRGAATRRRRVAVVLTATAILAVAFGLYALAQREEVSDRAFAAETARLGSDAGFVVERDRQVALLMAVETFRRDPGFEGLNALQRVLVDAGPYLGNLGAGDGYLDVRWVDDDRLIAATEDEIHLVDLSTGDVTTLPIGLILPSAGAEATTILATAPVGLAAVATDDGQVVLVDTTDGSVDLLMPVGDIEAMAISDDGSAIAIGRSDGTLEIFDRGTRTVTAEVLANPPRSADDVSLPTGGTFADGQDEFLEGIDGLAFDSTGDRIVSSGGVFLRAWTTSDLTPAGPEIVHVWGEDDFNLVATPARRLWIDEDDDVIVTAGESFVVRWSMSTGVRISLDVVTSDVIDAVGVGPGAALLLSDGGRVVEHTVGATNASGTPVRPGSELIFETQERTVSGVAVDEDRTRLAVATDDGIVIASLDGTRILARAVPIGSSDRPTLTRDGATLAAGLVSDGLFDLTVDPPRRRTFDAGVELAQSAGSPATYEFFTAGPSDMLMWTSTFMEMRNAYDLDTGEYVGVFWGPYAPAWSDDGRRVFWRTSADGYRIDEPEGDGTIYAGGRPMDSADFDSTGERLILVGGEDSSALVVDLETLDESLFPEMPGSIVSAAFTPDDEQIVTVSSLGAITLLDARTLGSTRRLEDAGIASGRPIRPPVLDDGGRLLFSASDGLARIWHVDSGRQIGQPLPVQAGGRPFGVADGTTLRVVTPLDGNALIWNLQMDEWSDLACAAAGRNMTEAEWSTFGPRDTEPRPTCPEL